MGAIQTCFLILARVGVWNPGGGGALQALMHARDDDGGGGGVIELAEKKEGLQMEERCGNSNPGGDGMASGDPAHSDDSEEALEKERKLIGVLVCSSSMHC